MAATKGLEQSLLQQDITTKMLLHTKGVEQSLLQQVKNYIQKLTAPDGGFPYNTGWLQTKGLEQSLLHRTKLT